MRTLIAGAIVCALFPAASARGATADTSTSPLVLQPLTTQPQAPQAQAPAPPPCCRIATGTGVVVELTALVTSKTAKAGDTFPFRLAEPIVVDGSTVVPAGAVGGGEVIDAAGPGWGGRPGKLVLAARFVEFGGVRIPLRSIKFDRAGGGKDYSTASLITTELIGLPGALVTGGNIDYPAGTLASAKIAADVTLGPAAAAPAPPVSPPAEPAPAPQTQPMASPPATSVTTKGPTS